jgi:hypothetical protein
MTVPTIAFAWWFASMPVLPPTSVPAPDSQSVDSGSGSGSGGGERVKPKLVTPDIVAAAEAYLADAFHDPVGSEKYVTVDGHDYVFVLEWHYHPQGYAGAPNGWHKGVTVYELR